MNNMIELSNAVELYFKALYECNLDKFDQIFHPSCSLFDATDGVLTVMPIADYRAIIEKRTSPASVGQARDDELISADFLSHNSAVVKVRLRIHDKIFIDHLNFVRTKGHFRIVAKIWDEIS